MNIVTHLQELDDLIVKHTQPPLTPMLRNKLAFCIQQAEARAADVERQEQTLASQIETIDRLMKENAAFIQKDASANKGAWDALREQSDSYHRMIQSKQLKSYD